MSVKTLLVAMSVVGALLGATPAFAQALFEPANTADLQAAAQATSAMPQAKRQRIVRLNRNALAAHLAPAGLDQSADRVARAKSLDGAVVLNLFPDATFTFSRTNVTAQSSGGYIWEGAVPGQPVHEALLLVRSNRLVGQVQLADRIFRIDPLAGDVYRITELDPAAFPPEQPPRVAPGGRNDRSAAPEKDTAPEAASTKTTIRVYVAYTAAAAAEAGGSTALKDEIHEGIALANQAYDRGKTGIHLVLAASARVDYHEGSDFDENLDDLTSGSAFAKIRSRRDAKSADLVSLFRKSNSTTCGLAWLPGVSVMPSPSSATKNTGFSVIAHNCVVGNYSWHHELGHTMGLQHDRHEYKLETGDTPSTQYYNFGYVNTTRKMRTVMAYNNLCAEKGFNCTRINWFSSPTIRATGGVTIGKSKGKSGAANASQRLHTTRTAVSHYR